MALPASDWLSLPVLPQRVKKFKLMLYPAKRFGDCSLSCVKSIQLSLAQPLNIPCGSAELTGNKISHLNSAGIAIPSNQFDFWWTKSPRKVDAFVSEKKRNPQQDRHTLISMLPVWQHASEWSILFWTPALPMTVHALAEQIKGMYLTCVLASENTKPYFLMRRSSYPTFFFFNLSSFSQTPLPEWEWKVRANQGVIAHHASQCYSECCPWFRVPDPKKTQSSMQSTGADFNARLPFLLQVHGTAMNGVFKGTFEEADSAFLCSSLQESDDDIFSCDSAESLDSVSLSTPDHLPVSIWSRISCFPASTSFFGWFVLGGFRLLHRRNSASKFFYHTNAS